MVTMGGNNLVDGGSTFLSGAANIYNAFTNQEPVDYSYNPAHEAVDAFIPEGGWNTAAHVAYDILDLVGGGVGIGKGLKMLKTGSGGVRLVDKNKKFNDVFVLNATGAPKPDLTLTITGLSASPRLQFGYDPKNLWHFGIGNALKGSKTKTKDHFNAIKILGAAGVFKAIGSYFNHGSDDKVVDNK